jgi:hypothetical protein
VADDHQAVGADDQLSADGADDQLLADDGGYEADVPVSNCCCFHINPKKLII